MGTRSLTVFTNPDGVEAAERVIRYHDGYPASNGSDLARLCESMPFASLDDLAVAYLRLVGSDGERQTESNQVTVDYVYVVMYPSEEDDEYPIIITAGHSGYVKVGPPISYEHTAQVRSPSEFNITGPARS